MALAETTMCNMTDSVLLTLQKDVSEIKVALLGNEYNPTSGVLPRLTMQEKELERVENDFLKLKDRFNKMIWFAGGAGAVAGFLIQLLKTIWL
jgi:hypothetical protein